MLQLALLQHNAHMCNHVFCALNIAALPAKALVFVYIYSLSTGFNIFYMFNICSLIPYRYNKINMLIYVSYRFSCEEIIFCDKICVIYECNFDFFFDR